MKEKWGSKIGFILAVAGSAIGLGNIWRFPYICGMNGGGAFVLLYLICVLLVGFPMLMVELVLGRAAQTSTVGAFSKVTAPKTNVSDMLAGLLLLAGVCMLFMKSVGYGIFIIAGGIFMLLAGWRAVGYACGMIIPMLITGYYAVIGGWTLLYMFKAFSGQLKFTTPAEADAVMTPIATAAQGSIIPVVICTLVFMVMCMLVLLCGVRKGIERWSKVLMPLLFGLLIVLIIRGLSLPGAINGLRFFLSPDLSKVNGDSVLAALGHSFFSMSLGMGIVMTYGGYLNKKENIVQSAITVLGLDTLAALMAGLAIFPALFAMGFAPDSGPVLIYKILPAAFNRIPGELNWLWNGLFFMMIAVAALTSGISLLEPPVRICVDEFKWPRKLSVLAVALTCTVIGGACSLSMSSWSYYPAVPEFLKLLWQDGGPGSMFELLDNFACNWMLPITGFLSAIYVGWVWGTQKAVKELHRGSKSVFGNIWLLIAGLRDTQGSGGREISRASIAVLWGFFIRFITPVLVLTAFLHAI